MAARVRCRLVAVEGDDLPPRFARALQVEARRGRRPRLRETARAHHLAPRARPPPRSRSVPSKVFVRPKLGISTRTSADLLGRLDHDPLRAANVAEPIAVVVALHVANELRAEGSQGQRRRRRYRRLRMRHGGCPGCSLARVRSPPRPDGVWNYDQLEPSVAVRGLHHRDLRPDDLEPHRAVHPTALDLTPRPAARVRARRRTPSPPQGRRPRCPRAPFVRPSRCRPPVPMCSWPLDRRAARTHRPHSALG